MKKNLKPVLQYYVRMSNKKDDPVYVHEEPFLQSKISEILYLDRFLPIYETNNGFLQTTEGWIQEIRIKDAQKVIPTNITDMGIWIVGDFIPRTNKNRTCKHQSPKFIVCEWSTRCTSPACSQTGWADRLKANETMFSNHYTVSSDLIIQHIPDHEEAYIDPLKYNYELEKNTIFIKIFDGEEEKARAVGNSLCRLLQTWYGHLNVIEVNDSVV